MAGSPSTRSEIIQVERYGYSYITFLKGSFFSENHLLARGKERLVLKISRVWLNHGGLFRRLEEFLCTHEVKNYQLLEGIPGVPRMVGQISASAFLHEYIEGSTLKKLKRERTKNKPQGFDLPPDYFNQLERLLTQLHARGLIYADLAKLDNILVTPAGRPGLIDFQISVRIPTRLTGAVIRPLLRILLRSDLNHLLKHKRKLQPLLLTLSEQERLRRPGCLLIFFKHFLQRPFRFLKRTIYPKGSSRRCSSPG